MNTLNHNIFISKPSLLTVILLLSVASAISAQDVLKRAAAFSLFALGPLVNAQADKAKNEAVRTIHLMSYNLKFASPTFKPSWEVRREMQVSMIRKYSPDIIGTQEGLKDQIDYLMEQLPEYVVIGEGRKGGDDDEHMAIFFKRDKFRLREMGSFQLSATPDIIGSGPSVNPRMVTWARFAFINRPADGEGSPYPANYRDHWENTQEFYVFNTHLFNRRDQAPERLKAAKLIMERMSSHKHFGDGTKERPFFLMGDFNAKPGSKVYKTFVGEKNSDDPLLLKDTIKGGRGIDWILYKGDLKVLHYERVDYNVDGAYPSDHKPISALLSF